MCLLKNKRERFEIIKMLVDIDISLSVFTKINELYIRIIEDAIEELFTIIYQKDFKLNIGIEHIKRTEHYP
jgi:hypothetical protein